MNNLAHWKNDSKYCGEAHYKIPYRKISKISFVLQIIMEGAVA